MKLGLPWLTQIQGDADAGSEPTSLRGWLAQTFKVLVAGIATGYHTEHNDDDTHSTIHATGAISERDRTTPLGEWIAAPFVAADFVGTSPLTWTVSAAMVTSFRYMLIGKTLWVNIAIDGSTLGGSGASALTLKLPAHFMPLPGQQYFGACEYNEGGTSGTGVVIVQTGTIQIFKPGRVNWAPPVALNLHFQVACEIQ